jgi:putative ABC transport system permease protein
MGPIVKALLRNKVRLALISLEIALTLAVASNCLTILLDVRRAMQRISGFDDEALIAVRIEPVARSFAEPGSVANAIREDLAVLRRLPGVSTATNSSLLPWSGGGNSTEIKAAGAKGDFLRTQIYEADDQILATLGLALVEGHGFSPDDVKRDLESPVAAAEKSAGAPAGSDVVVSRAFAELAFGPGPAVGKVLEDSEGRLLRIVGVVGHFYNPYPWPIDEYVVFTPSTSGSFADGWRFLIRTEPGSTATTTAIEEALSAAGSARIVKASRVDELRSAYFGPHRIASSAMAAIIALIVFVTSLGVVGLASFSVTERTRQIGTRRALGARRADILQHFLLESGFVAGVGLAIGVVLAYALNIALRSAASAPRLDPRILVASLLALWTLALLATLAPALRAAAIPPALATRNL